MQKQSRHRACFNPRVLAGGRDRCQDSAEDDIEFQSTRPRGRTRLIYLIKNSTQRGFNPRVLAGGRDVLFLIMA